jgi:hypothetical protein
MYIVLLYIVIFCIFIYLLLKKNSSIDYYNASCNKGYRTLNMSSGESPWKCGCCKTYGSLFDYKKQLSDQTYGVPNACQKIF